MKTLSGREGGDECHEEIKEGKREEEEWGEEERR